VADSRNLQVAVNRKRIVDCFYF